MMDTLEFFNLHNGHEIFWAHAVNSRTSLAGALRDGNVMMLEADVVLKVDEHALVPVMAHSSTDSWDITLREWVQLVANHKGNKKGIKLDFKHTDVLGPSMNVIREFSGKLKFPVWLNADIIREGPFRAAGDVVDPQTFFAETSRVSDCVLSVGWRTSAPEHGVVAGYSWKDVWAMFRVLRQHCGSSPRPVTFAVRASYLPYSIDQFRWLLDVCSELDPSLTIWTNAADKSSMDATSLMEFCAHFHPRQIYLDLFPETLQQLDVLREPSYHFPREHPESLRMLVHMMAKDAQKDRTLGKTEQTSSMSTVVGQHSLILEPGFQFELEMAVSLVKLELIVICPDKQESLTIVTPYERSQITIPFIGYGAEDGLAAQSAGFVVTCKRDAETGDVSITLEREKRKISEFVKSSSAKPSMEEPSKDSGFWRFQFHANGESTALVVEKMTMS